MLFTEIMLVSSINLTKQFFIKIVQILKWTFVLIDLFQITD